MLASTAISLVLAELALRVVGAGPSRFVQPRHLETGDKRVGLDLYPDDPRGYFPIDLRDREARAAWSARGLGDAIEERWEHTPDAVGFEYTAELCRGSSVPPIAADRARVMVVGDSFSEGQGVREEDTFAARLGRTIEGADVINCGRRGYDFPELATWFDQHLALEPDVVVYAMVLNDPQQSDAFHARQAYLDDWILDRRRMVSEGDGAPPPWTPVLFALLQDRLEGVRVGAETTRWYEEMVGDPNREGWEATVAHVGRMHDTMRARGGALVVALWPLMISLGSDYPFARVHETIVRDLGVRGVTVIDTLGSFADEDTASLWVHGADRHPNERGHEIFAEAIGGAVRTAIEGAR